MNHVFKGRWVKKVRRRGRGQACMLKITLFKQMAPSQRLIEIAQKFCCSKFRGGGGRGVHLLRTPLNPSLVSNWSGNRRRKHDVVTSQILVGAMTSETQRCDNVASTLSDITIKRQPKTNVVISRGSAGKKLHLRCSIGL